MHLTDVALLCWHCKSDDTWPVFILGRPSGGSLGYNSTPSMQTKRPDRSLSGLPNVGQCTTMCISNMGESEALFNFLDGLKLWLKIELQRSDSRPYASHGGSRVPSQVSQGTNEVPQELWQRKKWGSR
ncbi:hypothetical protein PVK06_014165 [Gossypium arboreum]|uniref:Uncharacterized protein n=1 Tax=Gossypium arboreum TaxID=29729 RepID=A0ABR0PTS9_GOSAR|nr:hypothetical protein PVK06_014165 [Gossypium arboreum]